MTGSRNTTPDLQIFYFEDVCLLVSSPAERLLSNVLHHSIALVRCCSRTTVESWELGNSTYWFSLKNIFSWCLDLLRLSWTIFLYGFTTTEQMTLMNLFFMNPLKMGYLVNSCIKKKIYISYENIQFKCLRISDNFVFICQTCNLYISLI